MKEKKIIYVFSFIFTLFLVIILFLVFTQNRKLNENIDYWIISTNSVEEKDFVITIIEDKRNPETDLTNFFEGLKNSIPDLERARLKKIDFSDISVKEYLQKNNITTLPAIIFSNLDFDSTWEKITSDNDIKKFLIKMESWEYFLNIDTSYNPFIASEKWLQILNQNYLEDIKNNSYFENWNDKKIIWLDFLDLSCNFCQKYYNSWIIDDIIQEYGSDVSKTVNFLKVHQWNSSEVLECLSEQNWKDLFFDYLKIFFSEKISNYADLEAKLKLAWVDTDFLQECVSSSKILEKIENQTAKAINYFWIKSTPSSVFIDSETWEYKIVYGFSENLWKEPYLNAINLLNKK